MPILGIAQVDGELRKLIERSPRSLGAALYREASRIMADSQANYVPVDQGVLRSSGEVEAPKVTATGASVTLGYHTAYALAVHENPRAGHTGGVSPSGRRYKHWATTGGPKYLERPLFKAVPGMPGRIAADLRRQRIAG